MLLLTSSRGKGNAPSQGGGGNDFLYDTTFSSATLRSYSDETVTLDGVGFYCWAAPGDLELVEEGPTGREFQCTFTSGAEHTVGLVGNSAYPGAGKKMHCAILLKYTGYTSFASAIKKTMRFRAGLDGGSGSICGTLNAQSGVWRVDLEPGVADQTSESAATHGPDTFIDTYRWLEMMLDFSTSGTCLAKVWVDGTEVISDSFSASIDSGENVDGTYVSTTFNNPAADGTDHIARIILHNDYIGVPA